MEMPPEDKKLAQQFDAGHHEYASFIETDPIRNFLHYPSVLRELGDLRGKRVLDIGCGDGLFSRMLAKEHGARVVGYDISPHLVDRAQKMEKESALGIEYTVADPLTFSSGEPFDDAVAVMVLPYSPDVDYIKNFFTSAERNLKASGKFVAVVFNPEFREFDKKVANRFFRKSKEGEVDFDFLDPADGTVKFNAKLAQFSTADYQRGADEGGFPNIEFKSLTPSEEGLQRFGQDFWQSAIDTQPYSLIVAQKNQSSKIAEE